jgi:predicted nucleotidyltransferase
MISEKIKNEILSIIISEINEASFCVFLFGSRAENKEKSYSDIDIGIWGEHCLDSKIRHRIEERFTHSNIPYKIDLIDFGEVDESFKKFSLQKVNVWLNPELMKNLISK